MIVSREVTFRASHSHHGMLLEGEHGHEYRVKIGMKGEPNEEGFVCDFRAVKRTFNRLVLARIQDTCLDSLMEYPTAENMAKWIWDELSIFYPLYFIEVREKPHSSAIYFGETHAPAASDRHWIGQ